jgi:N utilization substance protein A
MESEKITIEELRFISMFQDFTGATAYRCIRDESDTKLYFLVNPSEIGKAIGKKGSNVKLMAKLFNKKIEIIPYSPEMSLEEVVKNLFPGVKILQVEVKEKGEEKRVYVKVVEEDKGKAIGREGRNISRARRILNVLFGIDKVIVV